MCLGNTCLPFHIAQKHMNTWWFPLATGTEKAKWFPLYCWKVRYKMLFATWHNNGQAHSASNFMWQFCLLRLCLPSMVETYQVWRTDVSSWTHIIYVQAPCRWSTFLLHDPDSPLWVYILAAGNIHVIHLLPQQMWLSYTYSMNMPLGKQIYI